MKEKIPYSFVLDNLYPAEVTVRPMFGCHAVYIGPRIVLILRKRREHRSDNGVWMATSEEHHRSLKKEFPAMRSIGLLGNGPTNWQVIPESSRDFESSVLLACALILKGDPRIGTPPKPKGRKKAIRKGDRPDTGHVMPGGSEG